MKCKGIIIVVFILASLMLMTGCFETPLYYEVDFLNYDGSVYQTQLVQRHRDATDVVLSDSTALFVDDDGRAYSAFCTFNGWSGDLYNVTEDRQILPLFDESDITYNTFIVKFLDPTGAELSVQFVTRGEDAIAPEIDVPADQILVWDTDFTNVSANLTVKALFIYDYVDYVFDAGQGAFAHGFSSMTYEDVYYQKEFDVSAVEIPTWEHHVFVKWVKTTEENGRVLRFTAVYELETYTVTFLDHNQNKVVAEIEVPYGSSAIDNLPDAPIRDGYDFVAWEGADLSNITGDTTVYATYMGRDVIYTFYGFNDTIIYSVTVPYGSVAVVPQAPLVDGYTFFGWDYEAIDKTSSVWTCAVRAHYEEGVFYKLAFLVDGKLLQAQYVKQGECAADPTTIPGVDLTIIPENYRIIGWVTESFDEEGNLITTPFDFNTPINSNMTIKAVLETDAQ